MKQEREQKYNIMIYYDGQKLDENTDQQVLWEIVVNESIDIPFEEYADGDISNETILGYMSEWVESKDETEIIQEKVAKY